MSFPHALADKPSSLETRVDNKAAGGMRDSAGLMLICEHQCLARGSCSCRTSSISWVDRTSKCSSCKVLHVSPAISHTGEDQAHDPTAPEALTADLY